MKKYYLIGIPLTFLVVFNLGYVFHDLLLGEWLHEKEALISRDEYIIPAIGLAFLIYVGIQARLLPIFHFYANARYGWSITQTAVVFGATIGFLWDALQGGIIEYATFHMPLEVVLVDSSFHTIEGIYTAVLLSIFYKRFFRQAKLST